MVKWVKKGLVLVLAAVMVLGALPVGAFALDTGALPVYEAAQDDSAAGDDSSLPGEGGDDPAPQPPEDPADETPEDPEQPEEEGGAEPAGEEMEAAAEAPVDAAADMQPVAPQHQLAATGSDYRLFITGGTLYGYGENTDGRLGTGSTEYQAAPVKILENAISVHCNGSTTLALKKDGTLWTWGYALGGSGNILSPQQITSGVASVCYFNYSLVAVLKSDHTLWTWGSNGFGQVGNGSTTSQNTPVQVLTGVHSVSADSTSVFALKWDGTLWTWGYNNRGSLGNGTETNTSTPTQIMTGVGWANNCDGMGGQAIDTAGTLWMWGFNMYGILGNTNNSYETSPIEVMQNVRWADARFYWGGHAVAITTSGELWSWGDNSYGQAGVAAAPGNTVASPTKVLSNVKEAKIYEYKTMALQNDGALRVWGSAIVGDGSTANRSSPAKVLDNVKSFGGEIGPYAIQNDHSLWTWGYNYDCQVGDGTTNNRLKPYKVLDNVDSVYRGDYPPASIAVKRDGTVWFWGTLKYPDSKVDEPTPDDYLATPTKIYPTGITTGIKIKPTKQINEKVPKAEGYWDDNFFANASNYYNHELATVSMQLAGAIYQKDYLLQALRDFKFTVRNDSVGVCNFGSDGTSDTVGVVFAKKKIYALGRPTYLIAVCVRGTPGNEEWYGNFDLGDETVHKGFQKATATMLGKLDTYIKSDSELKNADSADMQVLLLGHSRGAAVANIAAKRLTDGTTVSGKAFSKDNIYAYTFATPSVAFDAQDTGDTYNNIFNLLHYDDFVPLFPLKGWGAGRYGLTLYFPRNHYSEMAHYFAYLTNVPFLPYNDVFAVGTFEKNIKKAADTRQDYYRKTKVPVWMNAEVSPHNYMILMSDIMIEKLSRMELLGFAESSVDERYGPLTRFFIGYGLGNHTISTLFSATKQLHFSHAPETYVSWMKSLSPDWVDARYPNMVKCVKVKCPVDVHVYDENGVLAGRVVNNVVDETIENAVDITLSGAANDEKTILLPAYQQFTIRLVGNDTGTMEYSVSNMDMDTEVLSSPTTYTGVELENGKDMLSSISETVIPEDTSETPAFDVDLYVVRDDYLGNVWPDGSEGPTMKYGIFAYTDEGGRVSGGGQYSVGAAVALAAEPADGYLFDGWYEDGAKLDEDSPDYSFAATASRTLEARFLPANPDIMVAAGEGGTVSGDGPHPQGAQVTLNALPDSGYAFDGWYEFGQKIPEAGAEYTFPATVNRLLEARFRSVTGTLWISKNHLVMDVNDAAATLTAKINNDAVSLAHRVLKASTREPDDTVLEVDTSGLAASGAIRVKPVANVTQSVILQVYCQQNEEIWAECRVDITAVPEDQLNFEDRRITQTALTADLQRTYPAKITLSRLFENETSTTAWRLLNDATKVTFGDAGSAGAATLFNQCFTLDAADEQTLRLVPTGEFNADLFTAKSYKLRLLVSFNGGEPHDDIISGTLTFTINKKPPALKAAAATVNTFFADTATLSVTGGTVREIAQDSTKAPVSWYAVSGKTLTLLGTPPKKTNTLYLEASLHGWAKPVPFTVKLTVASAAPGIVLSGKSVKLYGDSSLSSGAALSLKPKAKGAGWQSLNVTKISVEDVDAKESGKYKVQGDYTVTGFKRATGEFTVRGIVDSPASGTLRLSVSISGARQKIYLPLKVTAVKPGGKITLTASKSSLTLNHTLQEGASVDVYPSQRDYTFDRAGMKIEVSDAKGKNFTEDEAAWALGVRKTATGLAIRTLAGTAPGAAYKIRLTVPSFYQNAKGAQPGTKTITVKTPRLNPDGAAPATAKLTVKGAVDLSLQTGATVTAKFTNYLGTFTDANPFTIVNNIKGHPQFGQDVTTAFAIKGTGTANQWRITAGEALWPGKYLLTAQGDVTGGAAPQTKAVTLNVKAARPKVTPGKKALTLYQNDRYGEDLLSLTLPAGCAKIERVALEGKGSEYLEVALVGSRWCAVGFKGDRLDPALAPATMKLKLKIFLKGNLSDIPAQTLSITVKVV